MRTFRLFGLSFLMSVTFMCFLVRPTHAQIQTETNACEREPVDVSIVIDFSGSMVYSSTAGIPVNKLADARSAAKQLVADLFEPNDGKIKIGLVSFSSCDNASQTSIRVPLTPESGKATLDSSIDALTMSVQQSNGHSTCTHQGVQLTNQLLTSTSLGARSGVKKMTVFLTDGVPNAKGKTYDQAVQAALQNVAVGVNSKISYIMVGLGDRTGTELDEELMNCMGGVAPLSSYKNESCLLSRSVPGSYWFAPTGKDLSAIYSAIAGDISNSCATPTPTPKPSPTPLVAISSNVETDPSLSHGEPPKLIGGLLNPYCLSPSRGAPYSSGSIEAIDTANKHYPGSVNANGEYTITKLPAADNSYCIKLNTNNPNVVCTCPIGCQYCGKSAPSDQDLKFYVSPVGNKWYQTMGGEIAAQATSGVAFADPIPATCVSPFCSPFVSVPLGSDTRSLGALITVKPSTVNLSEGLVASPPNGRSVWLDTPIACTENYNYFYRMYSMGVSQVVDFPNPADAVKPAQGAKPLGQKNAFYYQGALPLTISREWKLSVGESLVVFVNGDLHINERITVPQGAFLAFIVSGNIEISPEVGTTDHSSTSLGQVQGVFIANKSIRVLGGGVSEEKKLVAEGTFAACSGIQIDRDYIRAGVGLDNNKYPGALFIYRPDFVKNTPPRMKTSSSVWTEVTP